MSESLSIAELIINASLIVQLVMLLLLIMSIYSWTIIFAKRKLIKKISNEVIDFEERFWSINDLKSFHEKLPKAVAVQSVMERIFCIGYKELKLPIDITSYRKNLEKELHSPSERAYRAMDSVLTRELEDITTNMSTLAVIASSSPYIGLFGTVWGIMHSFIGLSSVKQATIAVVAPGIAEALIATAIGLFVAIPATIAYNSFTSKIDTISNQYQSLIDELFVIFQR